MQVVLVKVIGLSSKTHLVINRGRSAKLVRFSQVIYVKVLYGIFDERL